MKLIARAAPFAVFAILVCGCAGAKTGVRQPTASERAGIAAAVKDVWSYEATFHLQPWVRQLGFGNVQARHYRHLIISIRVSRSDPRLATAAVGVLDARGRQTHDTAVLVLVHSRRGWEEADVPATIFPRSCGPTVSRGLRDLMCPDPWTVLGMRHTSLPASAQDAVIRGSWHTIELPGAVCGATHPIELGWTKGGGNAVIHSVIWPWWPAVEVVASGTVQGPRYRRRQGR